MDQDGHRNFTSWNGLTHRLWGLAKRSGREDGESSVRVSQRDGRWNMDVIYIYIHEWDIQYVNWYRILLINSSWTGERWWWLWCLRQTSEAKPPWVLGKQCLEDQEGHWQRCLWYSTVANHEMYLVGVIVSPFFVGDLIASPRCKESVRLIFAA